MENKKIRNATKNIIDSIEFKSKSEATCYEKLKKAGFFPKYEQESYTLIDSIKINDNTLVFIGNPKTKKLEYYYKTLRKSTYTPDFTFDFNNYHIIIEVKGFPNDVYPFKRKLFLSHLINNNYILDKKVIFFEVHSNKEIDQVIKIVKSLAMDYVKQFRELTLKVFKTKDLTLSKKLIDKREFKDLYDLVSSECLKEKKINKDSDMITERYENLIKLETLLREYCLLIDPTDQDALISDNDISKDDEEYT